MCSSILALRSKKNYKGDSPQQGDNYCLGAHWQVLCTTVVKTVRSRPTILLRLGRNAGRFALPLRVLISAPLIQRRIPPGFAAFRFPIELFLKTGTMVPRNYARLAQLVEQSVYTGKVRSSSLLSRTPIRKACPYGQAFLYLII